MAAPNPATPTELQTQSNAQTPAEISTAQKIQQIQQIALQEQGLIQPEGSDAENQPDPLQLEVARIGFRQQFNDSYKQAQSIIEDLTEDSFAEVQLAVMQGDWATATKILSEQTRKTDELHADDEEEAQKELHVEGSGSNSDSNPSPAQTLDEGLSRAKARFA